MSSRKGDRIAAEDGRSLLPGSGDRPYSSFAEMTPLRHPALVLLGRGLEKEYIALELMLLIVFCYSVKRQPLSGLMIVKWF